METIIPSEVYRVCRHFRTDDTINDIDAVLSAEFSKTAQLFKPGERIGLAVGSRGIRNIQQIVRKVVALLKDRGVSVFIIPAMGSHAGATDAGQAEMLASYGIIEDEVGAPVLSSMEVELLGYTDKGVPVHIDKNAWSMDGVVMLNRIKPHTDFHGEIESGLMKQIAVGLGKRHGAETIHRRGVEGLAVHMPDIARYVLATGKIRCGFAIVENMKDETSLIRCVPADSFEANEQELLVLAKQKIPAVPFKDLDVLLIQEMGKNISGTGIDPNVTGRYFLDRGNTPDNTYGIKRIVCLDLTEESHHNGLGVGFNDVISRRLFEKIDLSISYVNIITTGFLERGYLPIIQETDKEVLHTALFSCGRVMKLETARLMIIKNTLCMHEMLVSEALLDEVKADASMEILGREPLIWDDGALSVTWTE